MSDPTPPSHPARRSGLVPERLLLPPAPTEPDLAARWHRLPFDQRLQLTRRLRRAMAADRATAEPSDGADATDAELVRGLARARLATGWRLHLAALALGWLVLMTLWGFGRSTFPADAITWRAVGLAAGGLVWLAGAGVVARRLRRLRRWLQPPTDRR